MGASNTNAAASREFYKLKEDEKSKELRFFKQEKKEDGKWGDGEAFNQLQGKVVDVKIKDYEYQGEVKKSLVVVLEDFAAMEFTLGLRSFTAQGILNTLAGGNGWDLTFSCGQVNKKGYPTLWINKSGLSKEERRTNWKYQPDQLPKVTTEMYKGNKIKVGQEEADAFWIKVVEDVQLQLQGEGSAEPMSAGEQAKKVYDSPAPKGSSDLPF